MIITRRLNLDIGKPGQQAALYARQGDTRIYCILAALREGSEEVVVPADATVILTSTKPDGTVLTLPGLPEDGRVKTYLSSQALTAPGIVKCQIRILNPDGSDLYSPSFDVIVEDCVLPEDAVESSSDFSALTTLIRQVRGLIERTSLSVMGVPYETVEALHEAVPEPYPWSLYAVGASAPYDLYRYVGDENTGYHGWVNHGPIAGIVGPVYTPSVDEHGVISFTNNGGLTNPSPIDLVAVAAQVGKFLKYDTTQSFNDDQKKQIVGNIGALTYLVQTLTDPQKIQTAANVGVLSLLTQALTDAQKTQVATNAGVLSLLSQTLTNAQKTLVAANAGVLSLLSQDVSDIQGANGRANLKTNLITFTDASQIGITLSSSTTLEQLANAMPDNSALNIVPPGTSTTNITPNVTSITRYGTLQMYRFNASRVTAVFYQKENGNAWTNSVFSNDSGATWTTSGWRCLTSVMKTGVTSITIANGQQNASLVITFDSNPAFMAVPMVLPLLNTGYPGGKTVSLDGSVSPSATSFKVDVGLSAVATADTSVTIRWYALEVI